MKLAEQIVERDFRLHIVPIGIVRAPKFRRGNRCYFRVEVAWLDTLRRGECQGSWNREKSHLEGSWNRVNYGCDAAKLREGLPEGGFGTWSSRKELEELHQTCGRLDRQGRVCIFGN